MTWLLQLINKTTFFSLFLGQVWLDLLKVSFDQDTFASRGKVKVGLVPDACAQRDCDQIASLVRPGVAIVRRFPDVGAVLLPTLYDVIVIAHVSIKRGS